MVVSVAPALRNRMPSMLELSAVFSLLLLVTTTSALAQSTTVKTEWGGYFRTIGTRTYPDAESIYQFVDNDDLYDSQIELRLKNQTLLPCGPAGCRCPITSLY